MPALDYSIPGSEQLRRDLERIGLNYRTEIGDLDFHSLRFTFGTWLVAQSVDLKQVRLLMRHADINMTANRYTDISRIPVARTLGDLASKITAEDCTPYSTPNPHTRRQTEAQAVMTERNQIGLQVVGVDMPKQDAPCQNVTERECLNGCPITAKKSN